MNIKLVTGNTLETSVEASDDRALYAGIVGTGDYVFGVGQRFAHQIIGYGTVRVFDGEGIMQGAHFIIPNGKYDDIEIDACVEGFKRIDLICARYRKFQNMETVELVVVKGVETVRTPQAPEVTVGSILEDTAEHNMPLKKVTVQGSTIIGIENVFEELPNISELQDRSFISRGQLTSSDDLDDLSLLPGAYWSTAADPPSNMPDEFKSTACAIIVFESAYDVKQRRLIQVVAPLGRADTLIYRVFHFGESGVWREWVKLASSKDVDEAYKLAKKALGEDDESAWKPLTLANGVTVGTTGGVRTVPSYRKIGNKVEIEGSIAVNVPETDSVIVATLPAGYRPQKSKYLHPVCNSYRLARGYVSASGNITIEYIYNITNGQRVSGEIPWMEIDTSFYVD